MMNWYLLQTKPNAHRIASEHLKRQGFTIFLPLLVKTTRLRGKFVNNLQPLFPGYLFIGTELVQIQWRSVNATRGISKAVMFNGCYRAIAPEIIQGIKRRCNEHGILQIMDNVTTGDRVKIERGAFADFICNVDNIADKQRAWVLINILQQNVRAKVPLSDLSKVG